MFKQIKLIPLCVVMGIMLYGCNAGTDEGNVSISANITEGTCNYMLESAECQITITYNKGNESGLTLSYTPSPLPSYIDSSLFNTGVSLCNQQIGYTTTNSGTCQPIRVKYIGTDGLGSTNLIFTLGGKSTDIISISGWNI